MTEAEAERARIVEVIRETEAKYAAEIERFRCSGPRDPRWFSYTSAVHKRSMARVLALMIERGPLAAEKTTGLAPTSATEPGRPLRSTHAAILDRSMIATLTGSGRSLPSPIGAKKAQDR